MAWNGRDPLSEAARIAREAAAPLTQAAEIARSAAIANSNAGLDIDWSREPLSDRERRVRRAYLDKHMDNHHGRLLVIADELVVRLERRSVGSDLREAASAARVLNSASHAAVELEKWKQIAAELDDATDGGT